nr:reverse transcriptase domain-containing protein [Tanacetum cinerariifolium]
MERYGWRLLLGVSSLPSLVALLFYTLVPKSPRFSYTKGELGEASKILNLGAELNKRQLPEEVKWIIPEYEYVFKKNNIDRRAVVLHHGGEKSCTNYDMLSSMLVVRFSRREIWELASSACSCSSIRDGALIELRIKSPKGRGRSSNRRRISNIVEPEIRTIVKIVSIADHTMEELLQEPTKGYGEAIVILEILAENFEIKTNLLQLVQGNKFHGFERDNPDTHISNFKRMTTTLKYRDVLNDAIKLMLFPYLLEGAARVWDNVSKTDDRIDKLADQISNLIVIVNKQVIAPAKAIEKTCVTCGGSHAYYECIATDSIQSSVCAANGSYNQVSPPNRASHQIPPPGFALVQNNPNRFNQNQGPKQNLPFLTPSRLNDQKLRKKATNQIEKFFQIYHDLHFAISFTNALLLMPKFASTIKSLLANKDKLFELAKVPINENCSAMLLKKLPEKLGDPGKFLIPCDFLRMKVSHALADFEADPRVPLILRRSFLRTGRALIDVYGEELPSGNPTLVSDDSISKSDSSKEPIVKSSSPTLTPFEESDFFLEEIEDFLNDDSIPTRIENSVYDPEGDILFLEKLLNEDPFQLPSMDLKLAKESKAKSFVEKPPELDLKELPSHLDYAFLEDSNKFPVIIAKEVIKLLDAGMIYRISDSPWVSPIDYVPKKGEDQEKTTFTCPYGTFAYRRMPFGLCNAPGIEVDREKVDVIAKLPQSTTVKGVRSFLGSENLAADHLSRLENPHQDVLENKDINENFPLETLTSNSTPRFADIVNFYARNFIKKAFEILKACHGGPTRGHHGANLTAKKEFDVGFFWPSIYCDAYEMIKTCDICLKQGKISQKDEMPQNAVDYLSKWIKAKALPTNDARVVVKFLKSLFSRFGIPWEIISDRGTHFYNDQFTRVMIKYGVTHRLAIAYYPQTSGQVEDLPHND